MSAPNQPSDDLPQFAQPGSAGSVNRGDDGNQRKGFRLAPMTIADMLDATVKLLQQNWKAIFLLALVLAIPNAVLAVVTDVFTKDFMGEIQSNVESGDEFDDVFGDTAMFAGIGISLLVTALVWIFISPLISGAITRVVAASYLGRPVDAKVALKSMVPFWITLIGAALLSGICLLIAMVPGFLVAGFGLAIAPPFGFLPGALLALVSLIFPILLFAVVYPVVAVEETRAVDALRRSWRLMSRRFWMYMLTLVVAYLIAVIFAQVTGGIIGAIGGFVPTIIGSLIVGVGQLVSDLITTPILAIVATLMYFDARVRFEGFDVEMMNARVQTDPAGPSSSE